MKKLLCFCLVISLFCLLGCSNKQNWRKIPGYDGIMSDIPNVPDVENPDIEDTPPDETKPPIIPGFERIGNLYDKAGDFFGEYALVHNNGKYKLLHKTGTESVWGKGEKSFRQDRYVEQEGETLQLCHVRDGVVLDGVFDSVQYDEDTALAYKDETVYVYAKGRLISSANNRRFHILQNDFLIDPNDSCIYNLSLQKQTIGGYDVAFPAREGFFLIRNEVGKYGFASLKGEIIVSPQYMLADSFVNGYAIAQNFVGNHLMYFLINAKGETVFQTRLIPSNFYDGYWIFQDRESSAFTLYDASFTQIELPEGIIPFGLRAYGDWIIDSVSKRFYSLQTQSFLTWQYAKVQPIIDGNFIITDPTGKCSLLSADLSPLIEKAHDITYAHGIYKVTVATGTYFQHRTAPSP